MKKKLTIEILVTGSVHLDDQQVKVEIVNRSVQKGFAGVPARELIEMVIEMAGNISAGIIANFIYDRLKEKAAGLWINSRPVEVNKKAIEAAIHETATESTPDSAAEPAPNAAKDAPPEKPDASGEETE